MRSHRTRAALSLPLLVVSLSLSVAGGGAAIAQDATGPAPAVAPTSAAPTTTSPYPLEGTPWRLTSYRWLDQERDVGPEVVARTSFVDGRLRGSSGCNRLLGSYSVDELVLRAKRVRGLTERSCAEQTMVVELALLHGLDTAAAYEIVPAAEEWQAELRIRDAFGNQQLRFRVDDAGALTVGDWWLQSYTTDGVTTSADPDQRSVLAFDAKRPARVTGSASGDALGSSGCNGIVAEFFQQGAVLSFGEIERTDAPCEPAMAAQETAFVSVLDATALSLELPPGRLTLTSADSGDRLDFASSSPLEGGTWLLSRVEGRGAPRSEVTLRLDDGVVSGEGPCGSYSGSYQTTGVLVRFSGLAGVDDSCPDAKAARQYLSALRQARFVDATRLILRLLDESGRTVIRFRDPGGP